VSQELPRALALRWGDRLTTASGNRLALWVRLWSTVAPYQRLPTYYRSGDSSLVTIAPCGRHSS